MSEKFWKESFKGRLTETSLEASCLDFICMCFSLVPDLSVLLGGGIGEIIQMPWKVNLVRLGNIVKFFNKGGKLVV